MSLKLPAIHPLRLIAGLLLAIAIGFGAYPIFKPTAFSYVMLQEDIVIEGGETLKEEHIEEGVITLGKVFGEVSSPVPGLIPWSQAADYLGLPLARRVQGGQPLLATDLDMEGGGSWDRELKGAKTGMSIPVDDILGVTPHLSVGDRVHVYASFEDEDGAHSGLLLKEMPVIFLQREMDEETPHLSAVTIALTNREAVLLTHALHYGKIRLGKVAVTEGNQPGVGDNAFAAALMKTKKRWSNGGDERP